MHCKYENGCSLYHSKNHRVSDLMSLHILKSMFLFQKIWVHVKLSTIAENYNPAFIHVYGFDHSLITVGFCFKLFKSKTLFRSHHTGTKVIYITLILPLLLIWVKRHILLSATKKVLGLLPLYYYLQQQQVSLCLRANYKFTEPYSIWIKSKR